MEYADRGPGRDLLRTWGFVNGPQCGFEFRRLLLQPVWRFTERRSTCRLSKLGRRLGQTEEQRKSPLRSASESPLLLRSSPTLRGCAIRAIVSCLKPSVVEHRRPRWWRPAGEARELSYFGEGILEVLIWTPSHPISTYRHRPRTVYGPGPALLLRTRNSDSCLTSSQSD